MSKQTSEKQQKSTTKKTHLTTDARKAAFLTSFAQHGIVTRACRDAGIDRSTVYTWKEHDDQFMVLYNHALEEAKDEIREEVRRRAQDGWDEDVYQLGKYAGTVHKYSDTLLIFHAKMLMPEYREKTQVDVNANVSHQGSELANELRLLSNDQYAQFKSWVLAAKENQG